MANYAMTMLLFCKLQIADRNWPVICRKLQI